MKSPDKIIIVDRFAPLRAHLLALLAELSEDDWTRPTAAPRWSVKDVAAHLLGGDIGILSGKRDGFRHAQKIDSHDQLIKLVDRLNFEWVLAERRLSPRLLRELLAFCGPEVEACFSSLDPMRMGDPVSWAGPDPAPVWFDLAREFTERWHHQQQIRDATGRPPLHDPYFLAPVLDTFVRALPHAFRNATAPDGTSVCLEISGDAGGVWYLYKAAAQSVRLRAAEQERNSLDIRAAYLTPGAFCASSKDAWTLLVDSPGEPATTVVLPQDIAWRLFTKGIDREKASSLAVIEGRTDLAAPIFAATAVIG